MVTNVDVPNLGNCQDGRVGLRRQFQEQDGAMIRFMSIHLCWVATTVALLPSPPLPVAAAVPPLERAPAAATEDLNTHKLLKEQ
ncbi:hypothetical protein E2562_032538 [Oryza meyeriana var. granulata]|uniref:Uncharacterized protein n=1 Tax=Oryza meyeriana var. granulata TaxID=110450 RepID=A0A6G1CVG2_9ORYZ|nr:hypothetical protein E2562_032538 [Oryza meyeriana var. granulata]